MTKSKSQVDREPSSRHQSIYRASDLDIFFSHSFYDKSQFQSTNCMFLPKHCIVGDST